MHIDDSLQSIEFEISALELLLLTDDTTIEYIPTQVKVSDPVAYTIPPR